jgi:hypothetical protein
LEVHDARRRAGEKKSLSCFVTHYAPRTTAMKRIVQSELLDTLPPADPRAVWSRFDLRRINAWKSRFDLRRINAWMRNHAIAAETLGIAANGQPPKHIVELGAGDGDFLLNVARRLRSWRSVSATLLDQQPLLDQRTTMSFSQLGWRAEAVVADVFEWSRSASRPAEVVVANLFLHHFGDAQLAELLGAIAERARLFVSVEPRRGLWPLTFSRLLWVIACNDVTRHDAAVSVRAGFRGRELSALWPAKGGWELTEREAGPFSHLFVARRTG